MGSFAEALRTLNDMIVGNDVAVLINDEPRAQGLGIEFLDAIIFIAEEVAKQITEG